MNIILRQITLTSIIGFCFVLNCFLIWWLKGDNFQFKLRVKSNPKSRWKQAFGTSSDGIYDASLQFTVDSTVLPREPKTVPGRFVSKRLRGKRRLAFEDLAHVSDEQWIKLPSNLVYELFPQSLQMEKIVPWVQNDHPIPEAPINNQRIRFLHIPSTVCPPIGNLLTIPYDVVIIVKSAVYNFKEREELRHDYGKYLNMNSISGLRIAMVFSLGMPRTFGGNFFQREGYNLTLDTRAGRALLEHKKQPQQAATHLQEEVAAYGDLIVGDYEDTYFNLTVKLMHTLRWATAFCRNVEPTFVIMDDDYRFSLTRLQTMLSERNTEQRQCLLHGMSRSWSWVVRFGSRFPEWIITKNEIPWPYHVPDALGFFSIIGFRNLDDISVAMFFTKAFHVDDTWLGYVIHKLGLKWSDLPDVYHNFENVIPFCSTIFVAPKENLVQINCNLIENRVSFH